MSKDSRSPVSRSPHTHADGRPLHGKRMAKLAFVRSGPLTPEHGCSLLAIELKIPTDTWCRFSRAMDSSGLISFC